MLGRTKSQVWATVDRWAILCPTCKEAYEDDEVEQVSNDELEELSLDSEDRTVACDSCGEILYYGV